jgi:hypothetical protein
MPNYKTTMGIAAAAMSLAMLPVVGNATPVQPTATGNPVLYVQDSDGCSGGCGIDTNNKVQIWATTVADDYQITVTLDTNWSFMRDPTGNGHDATFLFSDTSNSLSIFNISSNGGSSFSVTSDPTHDAPYTFPQHGYGLSNSEMKKGTSLTFDVATSDATLALFIASLQSASGGSDNPFFVADVSSADGNTGSIDFGLSQTPLPAALPLFAGGLGLLGMFSRRRKQKVSAFAAP